MKKSAFITGIFKSLTTAAQFGLTMILARLLTPEEYGVIAVLNVFSAFFIMLSDFGLSAAIVFNKDLDDNDYASIFSFTVYIGTILGLLFAACAYPISIFYEDSVYIPLCLLMSISVMFNIWAMVPNGLLIKDKRFFQVGLRQLVSMCVANLLAIISALYGLSYYALIVNLITYSLLNFLWNAIVSKIGFVFKFQFKSIKKVLSFSLYEGAHQFVNYFAQNISTLLIARFLSTTRTGQYDKSRQLAKVPNDITFSIMGNVLFSYLSDMQNDFHMIYIKHLQVMKLLSILGIFFGTFSFCSANELIHITFGRQWISAVMPFKYLSLCMPISILFSLSSPVYRSVGATKMLFKFTIFNTVSVVLFNLIGVLTRNLSIVAICSVTAYTVGTMVNYYLLVTRVLKEKFLSFIKAMTPTFVIFILAIGTSLLLSNIDIENLYISAFVKLVLFSLTYLIIIAVTGQMKFVLGFIPKKGNEK